MHSPPKGTCPSAADLLVEPLSEALRPLLGPFKDLLLLHPVAIEQTRSLLWQPVAFLIKQCECQKV